MADEQQLGMSARQVWLASLTPGEHVYIGKADPFKLQEPEAGEEVQDIAGARVEWVGNAAIHVVSLESGAVGHFDRLKGRYWQRGDLAEFLYIWPD